MRISISIFLLLLLGCKSTNTNTLKLNEVSFKTVSKGVLFGNGIEGIPKSNFTINNAKEWETFLKKTALSNKANTHFSQEPIDFSKQLFVCVFDNIRNTSGFKIEIENIFIKKSGLKTIYTTSKPSATERVNMVVTQPYHIVLIDKQEEPITFINKDNLQ